MQLQAAAESHEHITAGERYIIMLPELQLLVLLLVVLVPVVQQYGTTGVPVVRSSTGAGSDLPLLCAQQLLYYHYYW
jgi:hypothetical protein